MRTKQWGHGAAVALCVCGCVTGINQDTISVKTFPAFEQHERIRKVAVVPFMEYFVTRGETKTLMGVPERMTRDNGRVVCDIFTSELRKRVKYKVVAPDKVAQFFLARGEKPAGILVRKDVLRVGAMLKADALVMGQVDKCSTYKFRQHNNARVVFQVRMADTATGEPIWQGSVVLDSPGLPHEVATRGSRLMIEQLMSTQGGGGGKKEDSMKGLLDR